MNYAETVSVTCTISGGDLPINVTWTLNGMPLEPYLEILTEKRGKRINNLMIDSVKAKHAGNYTCIAINAAGSVEHTSALAVNGSHKMSIKNQANRFVFVSLFGFFCFCLPSIKSVTPKIAPFDFGGEPSNSGDSASVSCVVTSGDFPIDFKWLFNERPISEIYGISTVKLGKRTYALTIDSVSGKHAGNYTCEASNSAGVDRYNAALIVNGISYRKM